MAWNFASIDGRTTLSLEAGNAQSNGFLTQSGKKTQIFGTNLSETVRDLQFSLTDQSSVEVHVNGDSVSPTSLRLTGNGKDGPIDEILLPMMNRSIEDIVDAYRRSFAVFTIGNDDNGVPQCIQAIKGGPTLKARGGVIGLTSNIGFYYNVPRNLSFTNEERNSVCQTSAGDGSITLNIPKLNTEAGTPGPVIIQFLGELDHFSEPPFKEPHDQIKNVFYEEYGRQCLTIEYSNTGEEQTLNFNHGRKKSHRSVIIRPTSL